MAASIYSDLIDLEDEEVPVRLNGRGLTWRETNDAYLEAWTEGNKASDMIKASRRPTAT